MSLQRKGIETLKSTIARYLQEKKSVEMPDIRQATTQKSGSSGSIH